MPVLLFCRGLLVGMLHKLRSLIADTVPIWLLFDKLVKEVGHAKFVIEAVSRDRKRFAAGGDFTKGCTAARTEAAIVLVGRFWFVCCYRVCAREKLK